MTCLYNFRIMSRACYAEVQSASAIESSASSHANVWVRRTYDMKCCVCTIREVTTRIMMGMMGMVVMMGMACVMIWVMLAIRRVMVIMMKLTDDNSGC